MVARMRARARLHRDREALGGFQESLVAMMVVAAGVTLLAVAMAMLPAGGDGDAVDPSRTIMERIIADERWTVSPGVLFADDADEISVDPGNVGARGVRVVLQEVDGPTMVLVEKGEMGSGERFASSRAVNVHYGPQRVTAATLTVWVWT